ncbi:glycerol-3-phosphate phosphatase-like isoform X2 [Brevipalpus obovatus]
MPYPKRLDQETVVKNLFNDIDYIISDCDGVLWLEKNLIEGTPEFFNKMRSLGKKIVFATNNNTKSRENLLTKLNNFGFNANLNEIMGTSYSVALYLKNLPFTGKAFCLGNPTLCEELEKSGIKLVSQKNDENYIHEDRLEYDRIKIDPEVEAVIVGMDYHLNVVKMIKACSYAKQVEPHLLIATNKDSTFPAAGGLIVPGTGSYIELIENVSGRKMISLGKPEKFFFDCIKRLHPEIDPSRSLMIGDRLDTDILFGHNNGIKYTLLVGTGVHSMSDVEDCMKNGEDRLVPTHYLTNLSDLNQYF